MSDPSRPEGRFPDVRGQRPLLLAVAAVLILGLGLLAALVPRGPLDVDVAAATVLEPLDDGLLAPVLAVFNIAGRALIWNPAAIAIAILFGLRGRRREGVILVGGLVVAETVTSGLKLLVDRPRPPDGAVFDLITQASFPSGHVTRTVVTLGLLAAFAWWRPSFRIPVVAAAVTGSVLMGLARVAAGQHWFSDVVGAVLLGLLVLAVVALILPVIDERASPRGSLARPPPS